MNTWRGYAVGDLVAEVDGLYRVTRVHRDGISLERVGRYWRFRYWLRQRVQFRGFWSRVWDR